MLQNNYFPKKESIENDETERMAFLPVKHHHMYELYKRMEANFWTDEEMEKDLEQDPIDRDNASPEERRLFDYVQSFFAVSDFIVADTLGDKILKRVKNIDVRIAYQYIVATENIHMISYSKVIDKAVRNPTEKSNLLKSALRIPSIKMKAEWIKKWVGSDNDIHDLDYDTILGIMELTDTHNKMLKSMHPNEDIEQYKSGYIKNIEQKLTEKIPSLDRILVALALMEGVFFSGSFAVIFWFVKMGKFPGAGKVNEQISRDEGQHVENGAIIHNTLIKYKEKESIVHQMTKEVVEIESNFMEDAMPTGLRGMNSKLMIRYIKYSADWVLSMFGYNTIYNINQEDVFDFMRKQSVSIRITDFFKSEELSYKKHGVDETPEDMKIVFDDSSEE